MSEMRTAQPSIRLGLTLCLLAVVFAIPGEAGAILCPGGTVVKYQGQFKGCMFNNWNSTAQSHCAGLTYIPPTSGGSCHVCVNWTVESTILDVSEWNNFTPNNFECMAGKGLTWYKRSHNSTYGTDRVGCSGCNAYVGDTSCMRERPILCLKKDGSPNPGLSTSFTNGWAGGHIGLTVPIQGRDLTSLATADSICVAQFGAGYEMASFHDGGGGWNWNAYGNISQWTRFWTYIYDQPANCWNN